MREIPRAPLLLGLAGLLPFLWGAVAAHVPALNDVASGLLGPRFSSPYVLAAYGTVILCFMSGCLWGFATKGAGAAGYVLSVIPALWAFFTVGGGPETALLALIVGFVGLLAFDYWFARAGLAPGWWMRLRLLLTAVVVVCLTLGRLA